MTAEGISVNGFASLCDAWSGLIYGIKWLASSDVTIRISCVSLYDKALSASFEKIYGAGGKNVS